MENESQNPRILVIGGAGYVGSHFTLFAVRHGYEVTVLDNLSVGHRSAVRRAELIHGDLNDAQFIAEHLLSHSYNGIFHFAASCLVGESVSDPAKYYRNNLLSAFNLLEAMRRSGHNRIVFSSTCAVYGLPETIPISEDHPKNPMSPYGRSKLAMEWMLEDYYAAYGIRFAALRYFNAAGCEPDARLGEDHRPETHLIPNVVRYALGLNPSLILFGNDYPTQDGTCVRDYIHVMDLAEAHLKALKLLDTMPHIQANLGTGVGISNLEIVQAVGQAIGKDLQFTYGQRRPGDPPRLIADNRYATELLQWRPSRSSIDDIVRQVITWFSAHPEGYPI